ncbi:hypothetical protein FB451DRAFT_1245393 [Mycena latifolia]|nr:hypothetical protein FB451DRAFT_1245393 [Mycena latifolia]
MSPFHAQHPPPGRAPDSSPARPPPPPPPAPSNPCNTIPNLWFVKVGADAPKVVEGTFVIEPEVVSTWGILSAPPAPGQPPNPKLCVTLMCLLTADVIALSDSLRASAPTPSTMAAAIAGLATHWPSDGTLILDINKEAADGGKTWLPHDIDPTTPLDVTDYIRPGRNAIRFIQLADMLQHTFILCASRREPPSDSNPTDASQDMDFDDPAPQLPNDLFNFCATVTVS